MSFTNTPLFGGAITVDLPSNFADTSQIREIPDHQEVYLDANGYSSIVVEILEYVQKPTDEEALQYHFADLVDGTDDSTTILTQEKVTFNHMNTKPTQALTFIQTPNSPPSNRRTLEYVFVHLLLLRLTEQGTDIMVTINIPHYAGEYEKAAKDGEETRLMRESKAVRDRVLETFKVVEWGLFDG